MINSMLELVEPALDTSLVYVSEIERMRERIAEYQDRRMDGDSFRRFRLQNGIYGMRGQVDIQMVRIKVPFGRLTSQQLDALGRATATYARGAGHVTTRQDIQLYRVPLTRVPDLLQELGAAGLTTRETSGSVVRNVTADALAGVAPDEAFDVRPYANTVARFFLRNPLTQNLPRKVKIAFSGSAADRAATGIHDIGALAVVQPRPGAAGACRGFQLWVGGGLGSSPHVAQLLEEFTPEDKLLPTLEAIVRVFDRLGNRQSRAKARLKFLVEQLGIAVFRDLVLKERAVLDLVLPQRYPAFDAGPDQIGWVASPPAAGNLHDAGADSADADYARWLASNVIGQKQPGYATVTIALPGGDLSPSQFHALAVITREFAGGECFTSIAQNIVLRWVPQSAVRSLYLALGEISLSDAGADRLSNVVGCPGADTCNTAIVCAHRLTLELHRQLSQQPELSLADDLRGVDIKVSGCPNSCGQHHVAAIGFYGGARRVNNVQTPHYMMLLGGRIAAGRAVFAKPVTSLPAKRVPEAITRVISLYRAGRQNAAETFYTWLDRVGVASLKSAFDDLRTLPNPESAPDLYRDWGEDVPFELHVGESECAV